MTRQGYVILFSLSLSLSLSLVFFSVSVSLVSFFLVSSGKSKTFHVSMARVTFLAPSGQAMGEIES